MALRLPRRKPNPCGAFFLNAGESSTGLRTKLEVDLSPFEIATEERRAPDKRGVAPPLHVDCNERPGCCCWKTRQTPCCAQASSMSYAQASASMWTYNPLLQPDVKLMLIEDDVVGLQQFCEVLNPVIVAEVLYGLDSKSAWKVLSSTDIQHQAEIFEFIEPAQQIELVASVDRKHLSKLVEAMSPDDRLGLLEHLDEEQIESLLPLIAQAERDEIRKMLSYPEDSAGAMMTTEYASLPEDITVSEALCLLRQQAPNRETIYYVFVVDAGRHLHGVISLRELILGRPSAVLADIMTRDLVSVSVTDDQDEAAKLIARFDLIAIPVLDEENRLVGIITHDDVLDVVQEEANKDAYLQAGINPLEHSYFSTPLLTIASKRGVWLLFLSVMALVTATAMRSFGNRAQSHDWLEWFLPLVLASGGNTGSQSATLVIRAMAIATMSRRDKTSAWPLENF